MPDPRALVRATLADKRTLMSHPPKMRRGTAQLVQPAAPAAGGGYTYTVPGDWWERVVSLLFTFTASSAAALRSIVLNVCNADGTIINQTPIVGQVNASEAWLVSSDVFNTAPTPGAGGTNVSGSVTGPTAGQVIATTGALPAGRYTVSGVFKLGGTTAAADANNSQLQVGATVIEAFYNASASPSFYNFGPLVVDVPAGQAITVNAQALGTGTAQYAADIDVVSTSSLVSYPQLPDLILKAGWQLAVVVSNEQSGDTITGIQILTERYASNMASGSLEDDEHALFDHVWW